MLQILRKLPDTANWRTVRALRGSLRLRSGHPPDQQQGPPFQSVAPRSAARGFAQRPPAAPLAPLIEFRAHRISDPVERLRYLRQATAAKPAETLTSRTWRHHRVAALLLVCLAIPSTMVTDTKDRYTVLSPLETLSSAVETFPNVWQVEKTADFEVYSNGLRVESRYQTANEPRSYHVFDVDLDGEAEPAPRSVPVGIVFHTTESHQAPFEPEHNKTLKRIGQGLLDYVREKRAYNFVIDRFGRVYRVVRESDAAHHAGHSVWADGKYAYVNLNHSFIGVSFEAQTQPGQENPEVNPAQIYAARILTEMLRGQYRIPAANCVTHAQVSVNPGNMKIGYHTDWAASFPFVQVGLGDNYQQPLPSIHTFGFEYDSLFLKSIGNRAWPGIPQAEDQLGRAAAARGMPVEQYQSVLRKKYRRILAALKAASASEENSL